MIHGKKVMKESPVVPLQLTNRQLKTRVPEENRAEKKKGLVGGGEGARKTRQTTSWGRLCTKGAGC